MKLYAPEAGVPDAIPLDAEVPLVIGREAPANRVLPFGSVSREHARVVAQADRWLVLDLQSRNSTFVNGSRIHESALTDGDELRLGAVVFTFCASGVERFLDALFGAKRGAFTGADRDRLGLVRSAEGGTLFLDEIGDMPLEAQAKLLRMLDTRHVTPLGSHVAEAVDVRVVSATHRPIVQLVQEQRFRADLYARISAHTIVLPPLRQRKEDLTRMVESFLARHGGTYRVTPGFMIGLLSLLRLAAQRARARDHDQARRRARRRSHAR